jgi:predicted RNA-binding protein with PUA-like domain
VAAKRRSSGACWLVKSEPDVYSYADLVRDKRTVWDGVRNFEARNNLRAMKRGDRVLYYHTGDEKQVVGLARVLKEAYPDPTAKEGDWLVVDLGPEKSLARPVTLAEMKADPKLSNLALLRKGRLSVVPIAAAELAHILKTSGTRA